MPPKGWKHSEEARARMSAERKGRKLAPRTPEHCAAISAGKTGKTHRGVPMSDETKRKISEAKTGVPLPQSPEWREKIAAKARERSGERHPLWKGDDVSYAALHSWLYRAYGQPVECAWCGSRDGLIEWANVTGEYKRARENWATLCQSCHRRDDTLNPKRPFG